MLYVYFTKYVICIYIFCMHGLLDDQGLCDVIHLCERFVRAIPTAKLMVKYVIYLNYLVKQLL